MKSWKTKNGSLLWTYYECRNQTSVILQSNKIFYRMNKRWVCYVWIYGKINGSENLWLLDKNVTLIRTPISFFTSHYEFFEFWSNFFFRKFTWSTKLAISSGLSAPKIASSAISISLSFLSEKVQNWITLEYTEKKKEKNPLMLQEA